MPLVTEILRACTNKNSIVLDFFAGSGTTLNAVNLLNKQDDGNRLCIMVTNNELSKKQVKTLGKSGIKPGDELWNAHGICRAVTWPRTVYTITGKGANGELLDGKYNFFDDEDYLMRDGFKANCEYFRLGFLDPTAVSLGMRFSEMLPTLWLKTGAKGKCPGIERRANAGHADLAGESICSLDQREYICRFRGKACGASRNPNRILSNRL